MKTLFIEAKAKVNVNNLFDKLKLPKRIGLVSAIQYLDNLKDLKQYLDSRGKEAIITGQVLGCNITIPLKYKDKVDAYLFLGSTGFYPIEVARVTKKPVYVVNPITNETSQITKEEVESIEKRKKGRVLNYLSSKKIGILVTIKPGQENIKMALFLKDKIKDKKSYIFVGNELNEQELVNFSDVTSWVNTCCSRIEMNKVVNFEEIVNYINNGQVTKEN
jgi:2-(3-amino-3-carboxypropyl)histidine synthase